MSTEGYSLENPVIWGSCEKLMCTLLQAKCRAVFLFSSSSVRSALARWRRMAGQHQDTKFVYSFFIALICLFLSFFFNCYRNVSHSATKTKSHISNSCSTYPRCRCVPCQLLPSEQSVHFCPLHWCLLHDEAQAEVLRHPQQMQQHAVGSYRDRICV